MELKEECIEFKNPDGNILRGILHHGNETALKGISVICLNTGLNDMVGWHRLQVKVARFLASKGYNVLRFDNFGIGNSEGELTSGVVVELFAKVETGMWTKDAVAAIDYMQINYPDSKFVFIGYCGGALTAIHTGAIDKRISGIINIGAPVTVSTTYLDKKDPWTVRENIKSYKRKLLSLKSFMNLLTGKSDYSEVTRSIIHYIRHKLMGRYDLESKEQNEKIDKKNLNFSLFYSYEKYADQKIPILFYYAELDKATWGLKKYFLSKYLDKSVWKECNNEYIEIEKANHIFSGVESQEKLKQDIFNWLNRASLSQ